MVLLDVNQYNTGPYTSGIA